MSRAVSSLEKEASYKSDDHIALLLLPTLFRLLLRIPFFRWIFTKRLPAKGIYEYIIARTKYIDGVFREAIACGFGQILIFGAGFDTRALRLGRGADTLVFELDAPMTQNAKIAQYTRRGLMVPPSLVFVPVDFERDSLSTRLEESGFDRNKRSLFILEGVLMYLRPESVDQTFRVIQSFAVKGSEVVFDYVYASVLRGDGVYYGERGMAESVVKVGEKWLFGIEKGGIENFLANYGLRLVDHEDSSGLEEMYFQGHRRGALSGEAIGLINGTHCLVRAVRE